MKKDLTLIATGDIFVGMPEDHPHIKNVVPLPAKPDLFDWFGDLAPILQQGDFTFGNLEGPICSGGEPDIGKAGTGGAVFKMPPQSATIMKRAGIDALALANNHTMDLSAGGLIETIRHLEEAGVAYAGGGRDYLEAHRPAILQRDGIRVAFLSYTSTFIPGIHPAGPNKAGLSTVTVTSAYEIPGSIRYAPGVPPKIVTTADPREVDQMKSDVKKAKVNADLVVVSWHWGLTRYANAFGMGIALDEAPFFVLNYQEDMGRAAIDAGADLVMGHHPHRLQGMEIYKGKLICYSLCNLAISFGEGHNFGEESVIVKAYIDEQSKKIKRLTFIPIKLPSESMIPYRVPINQAKGYVELLTKLSTKYGTSFNIKGDEIVIS